MIRKLILPITAVSLLVAGVSCNSSDEDYEYEYATSVLVSGFYLEENSKVLDSLQNVFFSIDLENAKIFNADSLPYGTDVSRLIPKITAPSSASAVTLSYPRVNQADSVVNYLTNSTDSIDFSNGPVKLNVVSQSGDINRTYEIRVNVHQVKPDSIAWKSIEMATLPSTFSSLDALCAAQMGDAYYCLTTDGSSYCMAVTNDPADPQWTKHEYSLPFNANVESMRATPDALYMLDAEENLYASADGVNWTATGEKFTNLYGCYGQQLLGCTIDNGQWLIKSYPEAKTWEMPEGFPVKGASLPAVYEMTMGLAPQMVMAGGVDAEGNYLSVAWGFDGENWACVTASTQKLAVGVEGAAMVAYDLFDVPLSTWKPVQYPALILIGGRLDSGYVNGNVYISRDWGLTWKSAPDLMKLPVAVPRTYNAWAFVYATKMSTSRSNNGWTSISVKKLPPRYNWVYNENGASRVDKPITEWECPAIYMFGGRTPENKTLNSLWRGQLLRFTFPPKY